MNLMMDDAVAKTTEYMHPLVQGFVYDIAAEWYTFMLVFVVIGGVVTGLFVAVSTWASWELSMLLCKPVDGWLGLADGC